MSSSSNSLALKLALTLALALPVTSVSTLAMATGIEIAKAPPSAEAEFPFDTPSLTEQASEAGLDHVYDGPWEYFVGGGAASFDCNGDRMPDLLLAGGANPAQLFVNRSLAGGALEFQSQDLGLGQNRSTKVLGAYPIDIDNDAVTDVVLLRLGENLILKGLGDCEFAVANRSLGFDGGRAWSTGFSAIWEKDAKRPTLAIGNYVDQTAPGSPWGTCEDNTLHRPVGTEGTYEVTALTPGHCSLSLAFTDWNNSGQADLRITNDRQYHRGGQEQLWQMRSGSPPRLYRTAEGWKPLTIWGMGIAQADLNGDGMPEYALTSMGDTKLQTLAEEADETRPHYRDIAFDKGVTAHRPYKGADLKPSTGWHAQFADLNNDAHLDLFIAKGNVEAMPDFAAFDPDNLLMGNGADGFTERGAEAGIALDRKGRGAVIEDFNADGMLDLLVVNRGSPTSLFRNRGARADWGHRSMGNWLAIELQNTGANRNAVGAKIHIKTGNLNQTRIVQIGGGHASGQLGFVHVGLGVAERARVRVQWPDGEWSHEYRVFANNFTVIDRAEDSAQYWYPR
ncbi:MAG: CRTAC1 family protein [Ahrensia sp.]|nr:CRTAC1 family protein [Ahrensia sp.]